MSSMDLTVPGDRQAARVRTGHNVGRAERWGSTALGAGLAILGISRRGPGGWLTAALGGALIARGVTGRCQVYEALGLNTAGTGDDTRRALGGAGGVHVTESITIQRPAAELYRFWRNLENLPRFMQHLDAVERLTDTISRWHAKGPAGTTLEWDAEIINEVPNQVIGWRSLEGADVVSAGSVNFDEAGGGATRVTVRLQYSPPGGKAGAAAARLLSVDAGTEIREDLRRFKQMVEESAAQR